MMARKRDGKSMTDSWVKVIEEHNFAAPVVDPVPVHEGRFEVHEKYGLACICGACGLVVSGEHGKPELSSSEVTVLRRCQCGEWSEFRYLALVEGLRIAEEDDDAPRC